LATVPWYARKPGAFWSWNSLERFLPDVRYGVRNPCASPWFTAIAVLVIALGIGATASLFTIVNALLLRPLPFQDPDKLLMVYEHFRVNFLLPCCSLRYQQIRNVKTGLLVIAALACAVPSSVRQQIQPMQALRTE
jgi:hypothetical protein